jgi:hypothetical protein
MIANIAGDDDLILPRSANPTGSNFRERQRKNGFTKMAEEHEQLAQALERQRREQTT